MSRDFSVVIERDEEGFFVASVPALPGCHTQARSLDELMERVRDLIAQMPRGQIRGKRRTGICRRPARDCVSMSGKLPALTGADVIRLHRARRLCGSADS